MNRVPVVEARRCYDPWLANATAASRLRILVVCAYVLFVCAMAYSRRDYLWIVGDDPNLLQQAILITKGLVPNLDFFSGYPGLTQYAQALTAAPLGFTPLSQHIFAAIAAGLLGLAFFIVGGRVAPWATFTFLLFAYSQGILLNPSPNPGYFFAPLFVLGLYATRRYFQTESAVYALTAGGLFALATLCKQYGVFGPVAFSICSIAFLRAPSAIKASLILGATCSICGVVLLIYFGSLLPPGGDAGLLIVNSIAFVVPSASALVAWWTIRQRHDRDQSVRTLCAANAYMFASFTGTIAAFLWAAYGPSNMLLVVKEVLVFAPRHINEYLLPVGVSYSDWLRALAGVMLVGAVAYGASSRIRWFWEILLCASAAWLFFQTGNLSATPFMTLLFVLTAAALATTSTDSAKLSIGLLLGISPLFLILIPYPNYAYHLPVLLSVILMDNNLAQRLGTSRPSERFASMVSVGISLYLAFMIGTKDRSFIASTPQFDSEEIHFSSIDTRWTDAISAAAAVRSGERVACNYGCRYLVFKMGSLADYEWLVEKPAWSRHQPKAEPAD